MILGVLIITATFALAIWVPRGARWAFMGCVLIYALVAVLNSIWPHCMPGSDTDARRFFQEAVDRSAGASGYVSDITALLNGWNAYINAQGLIQGLGGPSLLLGHSVSVFGSGLCLLTLSSLWRESGGSVRRINVLLACYTALPSVALYHSFILREVWQSLVVLLVSRVAAQAARRGVTLTGTLQVVLLMVCGAFLHKVMPVLIVALIGSLMLTGLIQTSQHERWGARKAGHVRSIGVVIIAIGVLAPLIGNSHFLSSAIEQGVAETSVVYATRNLKDARAEYGVRFSPERPWTLVYAFWSYECEPLPGRVQTAADLVAVIENLWRVWLLWTWLLAARKIRWQGYSISLIAAWFAMEIIWCVGTINWGTAMRHHVPAYASLLAGSMLACEAARLIGRKVRGRASAFTAWQTDASAGAGVG